MALSRQCPSSRTGAQYILTSVLEVMPAMRGWERVIFDARQTQQHLQFYNFGLSIHLCISNRTDFLWDILISIIASVHLILSSMEKIAPEESLVFLSTSTETNL